jgi:hypothetical protein
MAALLKLNNAALGTVIALVALGLSVYNFWGTKVQERRASLEVRREHLPSRSEFRTGHRLVVKNHGPARAQDVRLELLDMPSIQEDRPYTPQIFEPIPTLHSGQEFHITLGDREGQAKRARLRWHDGRVREQAIEIWLSVVWL